MTEKYKPKYIKGEIAVSFKGSPSWATAEYLGDSIGYEFLKKELSPYSYCFKVKEGKENLAIKDFKKYNQFVSSAERIDGRFLDRAKFAEGLELLVENLEKNVDTCDFPKQLEKIKEHLMEYKD